MSTTMKLSSMSYWFSYLDGYYSHGASSLHLFVVSTWPKITFPPTNNCQNPSSKEIAFSFYQFPAHFSSFQIKIHFYSISFLSVTLVSSKSLQLRLDRNRVCSYINYSYSESDRLDEGSGGLDRVDWGADEVRMRFTGGKVRKGKKKGSKPVVSLWMSRDADHRLLVKF